jgi:hypothetical protein
MTDHRKDSKNVEDIVKKASDDISSVAMNVAKNIDKQFGNLGTQVDKFEKSVDRMTNTFHSFSKVIERYTKK